MTSKNSGYNAACISMKKGNVLVGYEKRLLLIYITGRS